MLGEIDPIEFVLAEKLGKSLGEVRAMPNSEIIEWRSFYKFRHAINHMEKVV